MKKATDYEMLKVIQKEVENEKKSYLRMKKENVLVDLISLSNNPIQKLPKKLYIPMYERDKSFLAYVLERLGYIPKYDETYNGYLEQDCYEVEL